MAIHRFILHNGAIREASEAGFFAGQLGLLAGWGVFSTLRVEGGCLFAWERHWARMAGDARLLNVPLPTAEAVEEGLLELIAANRIVEDHGGRGTVRVVVVKNGGGLWEGPGTGRPSDFIGLTANLKKWPESVRLDIQPHGRYAAGEFARAKVLSWAQNLRWAEKAQEKGFDETLLLNEHGRVAECTSANVFVVRGGQVLTPPLSEGCLPGITREVVVNEIRVPGIEVRESELSVDDLFASDEVFITSSTRDLLAVREIAGRPVSRNGEVRERLSRAFQQFVLADVAGRKKALTVA